MRAYVSFNLKMYCFPKYAIFTAFPQLLEYHPLITRMPYPFVVLTADYDGLCVIAKEIILRNWRRYRFKKERIVMKYGFRYVWNVRPIRLWSNNYWMYEALGPMRRTSYLP